MQTNTNAAHSVQRAEHSLEHLSDEELLVGTRRLVGRSNQLLAELLAHLGEVEARGIHRIRACSSLYAYCIYELRFSEDAAFRRVAAARLVRRFPVLLDTLASGELHLTGLLMLGPHLTEQNLIEVLARAKHRTKRELARLVRVLDPLPAVPARIEPLGPAPARLVPPEPSWQQFITSTCPVRELATGERPSDWTGVANETSASSPDGREELATVSATVAAPARVDAAAREPLESEYFKVQFTATAEYVRLVEEAQALLSHAVPNVTLEEIQMRAMRALVAELRKKKYATLEHARTPAQDQSADALPACGSNVSAEGTKARTQNAERTEPRERGAERTELREQGAERANPREQRAERTEPREQVADQHFPAYPRQRVRHIPAAVRRAVFERDGNRCSYVDATGARCPETHRLEFHHLSPFAAGGLHAVSNLTLRCAAHNALAAEEDFGREFIKDRQGAGEHEPASFCA